MKEEGWVFASHTWGHLNVAVRPALRDAAEQIPRSGRKYVDPVIGGTDMIIFAFGADLYRKLGRTILRTMQSMSIYKSQGYSYYLQCGFQSIFRADSVTDYFRHGKKESGWIPNVL